ncbi:MAG TPA: hypothetical protein PLO49_08335 [Methanofastidiosum sp.]|jgi:hypothetical protein|nr:hypothetical protein [Methanofastidiosum sp.]
MSENDQNKYAQFDNLQLQVDKLFKERETSKERDTSGDLDSYLMMKINRIQVEQERLLPAINWNI